jgi:hypothetical protein
MIQERQKVQATYPNVDIAKAEVTARQKWLSLEQAVFAEFGKEIMESRSSGWFSMGGSLHQDKKSNWVPEHLKQYIPKEFQKEIQK